MRTFIEIRERFIQHTVLSSSMPAAAVESLVESASLSSSDASSRPAVDADFRLPSSVSAQDLKTCHHPFALWTTAPPSAGVKINRR